MKPLMIAYVVAMVILISAPFITLALETEPEALPNPHEVVPYGEIVRGECL